ncbi:TetR/AcrR family transcriptional regulator [Actinoallomurus sp. NPDC052308]|uniref:TetR/AcrR family transcriptional regulator n=1 Tax=Actinoallomurus sp. NPDC052308 TaxID=3155530 RepID=UPI0034258EB2
MPAPDASPRSRRDRPAKPALTADGIVAAAVKLMNQGHDQVTLRLLARELDTGPASLYVYFRNADELHAAMLDEMLGEVDLTPVTAPGDWRERLMKILASYIHILYTRPNLARSALVSRPRGRNYFDLIEALMSVLYEGGMDTERAAWGVDLLLQLATATAVEHGTRNQDPNAAQEWQAFLTALRTIRPDRHPHITAATAELVSGTPEARSRWQFLVLLNGILTAPAPSPRTP